MKISKHPGIRLKITLASGLVFALLSILLNLYSYHQIRQLIIADNDRYLLARAKSLLDKTEASPVIIPLPDKNTSLKIYSRHSDGTKSLLFQSPGVMQQLSARHNQGVTDTLGLRVAYVINFSDDNPAELMLAVSGLELQTTLRYLLLLLLFSTLLSVLVSGIISYILAGFFLLPVQKIINKAKNINAGQLKERVPVKETNDELQELAETINAMLLRIDLSLQQQTNFFASASHELKTPLAIMRAELEVNLQQTGLVGSMRELLSSQLEEISRLQNIVEEFLIISQIQAGKLSLNKGIFDLSDLCLKVSQQLKGLATSRNHTIYLRFNERTNSFMANGDEEKIRLVLTNLLVNAIKYSPAGSAITFLVGENGHECLTIIVQNPISERSLDTARLTNAFYRQHILQGGAGVGLWLCREILEAHHASLILKSDNFFFTARIQLSNQP